MADESREKTCRSYIRIRESLQFCKNKWRHAVNGLHQPHRGHPRDAWLRPFPGSVGPDAPAFLYQGSARYYAWIIRDNLPNLGMSLPSAKPCPPSKVTHAQGLGAGMQLLGVRLAVPPGNTPRSSVVVCARASLALTATPEADAVTITASHSAGEETGSRGGGGARPSSPRQGAELGFEPSTLALSPDDGGCPVSCQWGL